MQNPSIRKTSDWLTTQSFGVKADHYAVDLTRQNGLLNPFCAIFKTDVL